MTDVVPSSDDHAAYAAKLDSLSAIVSGVESPGPHVPPLPSASNRTALVTAVIDCATEGWVDLCEQALKLGADLSKCGTTALHAAAEGGHAGVCDLLLRKGVQPNSVLRAGGPTALLLAADAGYADVCEALLQNGATHVARRDGATPLYIAAANGDTEVCEVLLREGATDTATSMGDTPLLAAAGRGDTDVVALLVDHGLDVNVKSRDGTTPLLLAATRLHVDVCALLLDVRGVCKPRPPCQGQAELQKCGRACCPALSAPP